MTTVREEVKRILGLIRDARELTGALATEYLYQLSAWLGNIGEEIVQREQEYSAYKLSLMEEKGEWSMARVEAFARAHGSYRNLQEAKLLREAVVETIRSLKYRVRTLEDEFKSTL